MFKLTLGPLDSEVAQSLAKQRGVSILELISVLLREEAAVEIAGWRQETTNDKPETRPSPTHK